MNNLYKAKILNIHNFCRNFSLSSACGCVCMSLCAAVIKLQNIIADKNLFYHFWNYSLNPASSHLHFIKYAWTF